MTRRHNIGRIEDKAQVELTSYIRNKGQVTLLIGASNNFLVNEEPNVPGLFAIVPCDPGHGERMSVDVLLQGRQGRLVDVWGMWQKKVNKLTNQIRGLPSVRYIFGLDKSVLCTAQIWGGGHQPRNTSGRSHLFSTSQHNLHNAILISKPLPPFGTCGVRYGDHQHVSTLSESRRGARPGHGHLTVP